MNRRSSKWCLWAAGLSFLVLASKVIPANAPDINLWLSTYNRVHYEFFITEQEVAQLPIWPLDADQPPLAPRKAEGVARKKLGEIFPDGRRWLVDSIALHPLGFGGGASMDKEKHWIYIIQYTEKDIVSAGLPDRMHIPVLMNGTVPTFRAPKPARGKI